MFTAQQAAPVTLEKVQGQQASPASQKLAFKPKGKKKPPMAKSKPAAQGPNGY